MTYSLARDGAVPRRSPQGRKAGLLPFLVEDLSSTRKGQDAFPCASVSSSRSRALSLSLFISLSLSLSRSLSLATSLSLSLTRSFARFLSLALSLHSGVQGYLAYKPTPLGPP